MKPKKKKAKTYNFSRGGFESDLFMKRKAGSHAPKNCRRLQTRATRKQKAIEEY